MIRRPPRSTRTDTLFPYTTLFRSVLIAERLGVTPAESIPCGVALGIPPNRSARTLSRWVETALEQRSEEHTSELQSLMRISYAVFCLKQKKNKQYNTNHQQTMYRE